MTISWSCFFFIGANNYLDCKTCKQSVFYHILNCLKYSLTMVQAVTNYAIRGVMESPARENVNIIIDYHD